MDNVSNRTKAEQEQFQLGTEPGMAWASQNRAGMIKAAVALVVLVLLIVGGYGLYAHRVAQAETAFGEAMATYQAPVAQAGQQIPPGMKTFPDSKTRATAANAQFLSVANQYGMTAAGKNALYFAGVTYLEMGQNGSAEDTLKKVSSSSNANTAALAKQALAALYQQTGRNQDAIPLYEDLAKGNAATVSPFQAKLELAELYTSENKPAEANKLYAEVKDKDKDAKGQPGAAAQIATEKLAAKK